MLRSRGIGLMLLGAAVGLVAPAACSSPERTEVVRRQVREAGLLEAAPEPDAQVGDAQAGAPDSEPDAEPTDASVAALRLGVTPIAGNEDASPADQTLAELDVLAAGGRARALVARLDELVDASGVPVDSVFEDLAATAALYRARGGAVLFSVAIVDRTVDARPVALQTSWSSPELRAALRATVDRVYASFGPELAYLSFGTDVDRFLSLASASERSATSTFFAQAVSYAKAHPQRPPTTQVGVTFSVPGILQSPLPEALALLNQSDAAIVTDYPLEPSFRASPANSSATELTMLADTIAQDEPGLPVVLQELGYPSSTQVGSSPTQQAAFYEAVFGLLSARRDRFPFVNVYALSDPDTAECERQAVTFGAAGNPLLIAARCSLGLKAAGGVEKPAWQPVLSALSAFSSP